MTEITPQRVVVLKHLESGPKSWAYLRLAYYGPERAKSKASTSFMNQLQKLAELGLIKKTLQGYEITEVGRQMLGQVDPVQKMVAKSQAQVRFEQGTFKGLVDQFGYPIRREE